MLLGILREVGDERRDGASVNYWGTELSGKKDLAPHLGHVSNF